MLFSASKKMNFFCLRGKKWLGFSVSMIIGFRDSKRKEEGCALYSSGLLPSLLLSSAKVPSRSLLPLSTFWRRASSSSSSFWWCAFLVGRREQRGGRGRRRGRRRTRSPSRVIVVIRSRKHHERLGPLPALDRGTEASENRAVWRAVAG